jgi:hypothetical protein
MTAGIIYLVIAGGGKTAGLTESLPSLVPFLSFSCETPCGPLDLAVCLLPDLRSQLDFA